MKRWMVSMVLGIAGLVGGTWAGYGWWQRSEVPLQISGYYLETPKILADFTLQGSSGKPFTLENFKGRWTFVYFGFTNCPDVCPTTLMLFNQIARGLRDRHVGNDAAYLLISVDPERDTPEHLRDYVTYFNPEFLGATGDPAVLQAMTRQLGVYYKVPDPKDRSEYYSVDHSSTILLMDPDGRLRAIFTPPQKAENLVRDFIAIQERYGA